MNDETRDVMKAEIEKRVHAMSDDERAALEADIKRLERKNTDALKKEGPRGFAVLVQQIEDGSLHSELSEEVQRVTNALTDLVEKHGSEVKATITLTLSFKARANGTISVDAEVKSKTPKPKRPGSVFWATKGGNLSVENPRQARLPIRDVTAPHTVVDFAPVPAAPRTV